MKQLYRSSCDVGNTTLVAYVGEDEFNVFAKLQSMPKSVHSTGKIEVLHLMLPPGTAVEDALAGISLKALEMILMED